MDITRLFNSQPPDEDELVRELFVDRPAELQNVLDSLGGAGAEHTGVCVVYGEPRCGKSHLIKRAFVELKDRKEPVAWVEVNAHRERTAENALRAIFLRLTDALEAVKLSSRASDERKALLQYALAHLRTVRELIGTTTDEIEIEQAAKTVETVERNLKAHAATSIGGKILSLISASVSLGVERVRGERVGAEAQEKVRYIVRQPSDEGLVDLIAFVASVLIRLTRKKRVLLFVDDLDLLSYRTDRTQAEEHSITEHLIRLAGCEAINVVAAVRDDFYGMRAKDLRALHKRLKPLSPRDLSEMWRKRIKLFYGTEGFFTSDALQEIFERSEFLVGRVIDNLHTLFLGLRQEGAPVDSKLVDSYLSDDWKDLKRSIPTEASGLIAQRVSQGQLQISADDLRNAGFEPEGSMLLTERVLIQDAYRPEYYTVSGLYSPAIREASESGD